MPAPLEDFQSITEGGATVLFRKGQVFYNQVQIFNRDLSVAVIRTWDEMRREKANPREVKRSWGDRDAVTPNSAGDRNTFPPMRILEALSASGLRSVRYAKELPQSRIGLIVANDIDAAAVQAIQRNISYNGLNDGRVVGNAGDAALVMQLTARGVGLPGMDWMKPPAGAPPAANPAKGPTPFWFDVVDLDPYGSASVFLDGAVQAVAEGGLLCVTCTDMAVLAGNHQDACHAKYGTVPVKGRHFSEQALRIVLATIEASANRHKRTITPILAVQPDFYLRVFVTVKTSAQDANNAPLKLGNIHQCTGCDAFWLWPLGKNRDSGKGLLKFRSATAGGASGAGAAATEPAAEAAAVGSDEAEDADDAAEAGASAASSAGAGATQTWTGADASGEAKAKTAGVKRKLLRHEKKAAREQALQSETGSAGGSTANANIAPEVPHCCPFCGRFHRRGWARVAGPAPRP